METLFNFTGQVVLISGSSQGIGLATAQAFSRCGAEVILVARERAKLEQARLSLPHPEQVAIHPADLSREVEFTGLFAFFEGHFGRLDVLVNNLGAFSEKRGWDSLSHETWVKAFETNTLSAYFCMQRAAALMSRQGIAGAIVNVGSSAALQLKKGRIHYTVTKASLHTLSQVAAMELASKGIRVNVVSPGPTATEVVQRRMADSSLAPAEQERMRKVPLGRFAKPEEIADAILFLSSPMASFITGAILPVDGGYTLGETQ